MIWFFQEEELWWMGCPYGHPDPLEEPSIMEISRRQDRRSRQTNHPLTILSVISSASFPSNHYLHCHYHCHHSTPPYHNLYGPFGCARKETFPSPRSVPNYGMPFHCIPSCRPWARLIAKCCDDSAKIVGVDKEVSIWSSWAAGLWMTEAGWFDYRLCILANARILSGNYVPDD